jgi:predicted amidohydrolase YtcJ
LGAIGAFLLISAGGSAASPADYVLTHARIYTADARRSMARALAVSDGKIVYVGGEAGARAFIGPKTQVEAAGGRLVLPGLVDAHIHPLGIVDLDVCTLKSREISLEGMAPFIQDCIRRYAIKPGAWVVVQQWNFTGGNEPSAAAPTLRAALDRASTAHPVVLLGNDGHHGAFNSMALAGARDGSGRVIGLSRATLKTEFSGYKKLIGVDAAGEPDGSVNEDARDLMRAPDFLAVNYLALTKAPEKMSERLSSAGITAFQDANVIPPWLYVYDTLLKRNQLNQRVNLIQHYEPEDFKGPDGRIDYDRIVRKAVAIRERYAGNDLVRAEAIKIFADGVLEGNPYANPPTLPDSPSLKPYLQPIFGRDGHGKLTVKGYVDLSSEPCKAVRAAPETYEDDISVAAFTKSNGFHPGQCAISSGKPQHDHQVMLDYATAMHEAGFTLHIHAIGDAAVASAIDAIEAARAADGVDTRPDTIAHLQVVSPDDVARIGRDHLFLAFTYSWATAVPEYDMAVVPFFERVSGASYAALHDPDTYYERQFYPARSIRDAGGVLAAGSDAPVNTLDPQPFVNIEIGVTRAQPGYPPANPAERLTVPDLIDAYTINGARAMGRETEFGSIEVGKSADFILIDQDIIALARHGRAAEISKTKVVETWFRGKRVYRSTPP